MANCARKYKYTGVEFVAPSGDKVSPGMSNTFSDWGDLTGVKPATIRNRYDRLVNKKIGKRKSFNLALNHKKKIASTNNEYVYTYKGDSFTTSSGRKIERGERRKLGEWLEIVGMNRMTFISRGRRSITLGSKGLFSDIISQPVKSTNKKAKIVPVITANKKRLDDYGERKVIRQEKRRLVGSKMVRILQCRVMYPDQPCVPCRFKKSCFGEVRA